jgi:hypothetical protein
LLSWVKKHKGLPLFVGDTYRDLGESKNTLKKNGPSQLLLRNIQ